MAVPLMPKATAAWLIENSGLTFEQISRFCGLHILEVQGIADGEVGAGIQGLDPLVSGQLTKEEIRRCEQDPKSDLKLLKKDLPQPIKRTKGPRYTPVAKRQDKPDAIAWLLRHHPELKESQIAKLIGTTKTTIQAIDTRSHWNASNIRPRDPVLLGLCSQGDLNAAVERAQRSVERAKKKSARETAKRAQEKAGGAAPAVEDAAAGAGEATPEIPNDETPQDETPQAETAEAETPQAETPQAETPQAETPQADTAEAETPETESAPETPAADDGPAPQEEEPSPGFGESYPDSPQDQSRH